MARLLHAGTPLVHSGDTKRPFNLLEISIKAYYRARQTPNGNKGHFFFLFPQVRVITQGKELLSGLMKCLWQWVRDCRAPAGVTGLTCGLLIAPKARFKLRLEPQTHLSFAVGTALPFLTCRLLFSG